MSKSIEQRATEVLTRASFGGAFVLKTEVAVRALREANLLAHPLAEEAMEACKAYAQKYGGFPYFKEGHNDPVDHIESVGRRILESEKKDEGPWRVHLSRVDNRYFLRDLRDQGQPLIGPFLTQHAAETAEVVLNSLHRKERQR